MVATVVLNQNNLVQDGNNNTFVYKFPNSVSFPHHEIAIQSISMFYSWTNINSSPLNNNTFSFTFPTSSGPVSHSILVPTGQYEISDLNALMQYNMILNGNYLINSAGQNVYFAEMLVNATRYAVQVNTFPVPTSTGWTQNVSTGQWTGNTGTAYAGWKTPLANAAISGSVAWQGFPSVTANATVTFPANFNQIVGFTAGYTTPQPSLPGQNFSVVSTVTPQVQPNSSIYFSISNIQNPYAIPSSIIYSLNPAVSYGLQINEYPPQFAWNKLLNGTYNEIRMQILGLNFQGLQILDPNMTIVLVIRDMKDIGLQDALASANGGK